MSVFSGMEYVELRKNRTNAIINHFGGRWFGGKKILELGCGHADMGNVFYHLGAELTVSDAREEHLESIRRKYPGMKPILHDHNSKSWPFENNYDLILNMGVLYHLKEFEQFLGNCLSNCKKMFLESIVTDSIDPSFVQYKEENGPDQSFTNIGCRPSAANIERIIQKNNFSFERCFKKELNSMESLFDWKPTNSGTHSIYINEKFFWLRRAWFCSK